MTDVNPDQADAAILWNESTQWEGQYPLSTTGEPLPARLRDRLEHQGFDEPVRVAVIPRPNQPGSCRVSAMRDGRYRVHWTSSQGRHGVDGPFPSLDAAASWCERYESLTGWRWLR